MEFYPTNEYREVTLQVGLNSVQLGNTDKLFSDGLDEYSCAVTPQVRQTGNRLSGLAGTAYASLLT